MSLTGVEPIDTAQRPRLGAPDAVRSVALLGVVIMNYHGYLILRGGQRGGSWAADLFDPWTGPLSTRFAATFVLVAGVGVTLLTASSTGQPGRIRELRWRLASRGLALYVFGLGLDMIWSGTILVFYGAMFAVAAVIFTLRSRWLLIIGAAAALGGWGIRIWRYEQQRDGISTAWLTSPGSGSPRGLVLDVMVNGTHPLLPWLAFFCTGIVAGRVLLDPSWRRYWTIIMIAAGFVLYSIATLAHTALVGDGTDARAVLLWSTDPFDRGILYTASALGTALMGFGVIGGLAERFDTSPVVDGLARTGQLSLTVYIAHVLVFNLVVDWLGWVEPAGVGTALGFALVVWLAGSLAALAWQRRRGRGPAEHVYRSITA
jgi:uncharacterized protein